MYEKDIKVIEFDKWNRKILNIFWIIAGVAIITESAIFWGIVYPVDGLNISYILKNILKPAMINAAIMTGAEVIYYSSKNKHKEYMKYLVIICGTLIVCNMVYIHYPVAVIYALFSFPIFFSVFYGDKKLTYFTMVMNLIFYFIVYFAFLPTKPPSSYRHNSMDFCTTISFMFSALLLVSSFIDRNKEIINSLQNAYEREQKLAIKNFVMEFNSKIEPVTGLYNHKTFYEYLENLINQSESFKFNLSLAVLDIDNFKKVNDTYGHSLGDKVIKALSEVIKNNIGTDDYAFRYGGEEFAVILTDKNKDEAHKIAERIRKSFNDINISEMKEERFSISIGIAQHVTGMSKQSFFENADAALYKAKSTGKNKTVIHYKDLN